MTSLSEGLAQALSPDADRLAIGNLPDVTDLSFLEACPLLRHLEVCNCPRVENLASLSALTKIETLTLRECRAVHDLSPLKSLPNLRSLDIGFTAVSNLDVLPTLPSLAKLGLTECRHITDLSPLAGCQRLRHLHAPALFAVHDLNPISRLTRLETLDIGHHDLSGGAPWLAELTDVRTIDLDGTGITDLSPLARMDHLRNVNLDGNRALRSIEPLRGSGALQLLILRGCTSLESISPLQAKGWLHTVDLTGCTQITDLSPLTDSAASLEAVFVGGTAVRHVPYALTEVVFFS